MEKAERKSRCIVTDTYKKEPEGEIVYIVRDSDGIQFECSREEVMSQYPIAVMNFFERELMLEDQFSKEVHSKLVNSNLESK